MGSEVGLRNNEVVATRSEGRIGGVLLDIAQRLVGGGREARGKSILREGGRLGAEARCVGGGLAAKLGEVEIGAGLVAHVHRLVKLPLRPVSVKDDAVKRDADDLDHQLDNDANKSPVLEAADKGVVDLAAKEFGSTVFDAGPSPHILVTAVGLGVLEDSGGRSPHSHTENEPADREQSVIDADLLRSPVTTTAVANKDTNADDERDTSTGENDFLRPGVCVVGPSRKTAHRCKSLGGVENGERGRDHGQDNQGAAEVDTTEGELGHSYSGLDFLP